MRGLIQSGNAELARYALREPPFRMSAATSLMQAAEYSGHIYFTLLLSKGFSHSCMTFSPVPIAFSA